MEEGYRLIFGPYGESFGAVPLFTGTMLITAIAMLVAVPVGLMTAIYLAEYSSPTVRSTNGEGNSTGTSVSVGSLR